MRAGESADAKDTILRMLDGGDFCSYCARPIATKQDWAEFPEGGGEHLCWDGGDAGCTDDGAITLRRGDVAALLADGERDRRKVEAYDATRAEVKIDGYTRAYYVLRAQHAENELKRDRRQIERLTEAFATLKNGPLHGILETYRQEHPDDGIALSTVIAETQEIAAVLTSLSHADRDEEVAAVGTKVLENESSDALPPHDHTVEPGEINRRGCRRCQIESEAELGGTVRDPTLRPGVLRCGFCQRPWEECEANCCLERHAVLLYAKFIGCDLSPGEEAEIAVNSEAQASEAG